MGWSIEPSIYGASIDSTGKATFPSDSTIEQYTITYDDGNGCTVSTLYNIPQGCGGEPPTPPGPQPIPDCIRGTDNGNDIIANVPYPHPFLCCGGGRNNDMDSLYVQHISYNGIPISTSSSSPTVINDWLSVYRTETGGVVGYGALFYKYGANTTSGVREVNITYTTSDSDVSPNASPAQEYGKTNACPSWTVTVKQCRQGYIWCCKPSDAYDNKCHSYTAFEETCDKCQGGDKEIESCGSDCN